LLTKERWKDGLVFALPLGDRYWIGESPSAHEKLERQEEMKGSRGALKIVLPWPCPLGDRAKARRSEWRAGDPIANVNAW
jgi:hypothetical protein